MLKCKKCLALGCVLLVFAKSDLNFGTRLVGSFRLMNECKTLSVIIFVMFTVHTVLSRRRQQQIRLSTNVHGFTQWGINIVLFLYTLHYKSIDSLTKQFFDAEEFVTHQKRIHEYGGDKC